MFRPFAVESLCLHVYLHALKSWPYGTRYRNKKLRKN